MYYLLLLRIKPTMIRFQSSQISVMVLIIKKPNIFPLNPSSPDSTDHLSLILILLCHRFIHQRPPFHLEQNPFQKPTWSTSLPARLLPISATGRPTTTTAAEDPTIQGGQAPAIRPGPGTTTHTTTGPVRQLSAPNFLPGAATTLVRTSRPAWQDTKPAAEL